MTTPQERTALFVPKLGDSSVLKALAPSLPNVPHVQLREPDGSPGHPTELPPEHRYDLCEEIARGGMGLILRGHDNDLNRDIAIKVLLAEHVDKPAMVKRFIEEAQIGGQLQHPGIVPVYELGQFPDRRLYFTMKLVKGQTLATLLSERASPTRGLSRFLTIFHQVCQTMAYAHARGVIHRDLKPANVMAGSFGEVLVMDWGLAKVLAGSPAPPSTSPPTTATITTLRGVLDTANGTTTGQKSSTQTGTVLGTPAYMPPEQAQGQVDDLDERCDVFGLGAMLCEILTGQPPHVGRNATETFQRASQADLTDAEARLATCGADPDLVRLVRRCLAGDAVDRPRDAGVVTLELASYLQSVQDRLRAAELARGAATALAASAAVTR